MKKELKLQVLWLKLKKLSKRFRRNRRNGNQKLAGDRRMVWNNTDVNSVDKNSAAIDHTDCSDARFKKMFVICNTPAYKIVLEENVEHGQNNFTMSGKEKRSSSEGSNYYDDLLN